MPPGHSANILDHLLGGVLRLRRRHCGSFVNQRRPELSPTIKPNSVPGALMPDSHYLSPPMQRRWSRTEVLLKQLALAWLCHKINRKPTSAPVASPAAIYPSRQPILTLSGWRTNLRVRGDL